MQKQNEFPPGWDEERVQSVIAYYDQQTEDEAVAEAEAALQNESSMLIEVPIESGRFSFRFRSWFRFIGVNIFSQDRERSSLLPGKRIHIDNLLATAQLDTSRLHGDGSNTVVKRGAMAPDIQDTNTRKVKKN